MLKIFKASQPGRSAYQKQIFNEQEQPVEQQNKKIR